MSTDPNAGLPVRSRPLRALQRVVNPLMRALLQSPAHRMASGSTLILGFNGRSSGKRYELVVGYREREGVIEIVCPGNWWKNLRGNDARVDVRYRGAKRQGRAEVHHRDETVVEVYRRLMTDSPSVVRVYGVSRDPDGTVDDESLRAAVRTCAVVLVRVDPL